MYRFVITCTSVVLGIALRHVLVCKQSHLELWDALADISWQIIFQIGSSHSTVRFLSSDISAQTFYLKTRLHSATRYTCTSSRCLPWHRTPAKLAKKERGAMIQMLNQARPNMADVRQPRVGANGCCIDRRLNEAQSKCFLELWEECRTGWDKEQRGA